MMLSIARMLSHALPYRSTSRSVRTCLLLFLASAGSFAVNPDTAYGIPLYARRHALNCNACHQIVPTLNRFGLDYWNRGYRLPPGLEDPNNETTPFAAWYTWRQEDQTSRGFGEGFLPKVELIAGGPLGEKLSYFVE